MWISTSCCFSGNPSYLDQAIGVTPAVLGVASDGLQFRIQELIGGGPVHIAMNFREEELQELLEILADGFFPGRIVVVCHALRLAGRFLPNYFRPSPNVNGRDRIGQGTVGGKISR